MSTTTTIAMDRIVIKIEDSPEPTAPILPMSSPANSNPPASSNPQSSSNPTAPVFDPKDPEGFLRRCSGYNKKKGVRCSAVIGRNSHYTKSLHPTFLPTCYAHKDQQSYAGWCQFVEKEGERCGRLFRWTPPYFELCTEHQGHPDTPCYFIKMPLELRLEVFRYLLPSKPIGSSTALVHVNEEEDALNNSGFYTHQYHSAFRPAGVVRRGPPSPLDHATCSVFPVPLLDLLLVNRQMYAEVKDCLYSTVPFTIDVRKDGTFMCGRRILEPRRADGSAHFVAETVDKMKSKFLTTFDWAAVKNYDVNILVENWKEDAPHRGYHSFPWDEEVEIYDIRDYIGVVVSGILSKSRNLCKLNVQLGISKFNWVEEEYLDNIQTLVGPFERLRNVRQPRLIGVYEDTPRSNFMINLPLPLHATDFGSDVFVDTPRVPTPLCSVPQLPSQVLLPITTAPAFCEYQSKWMRWISSSSSTSLVRKPPIRAMFTEFKEFYTKLSAIVPEVMSRAGKFAFLHRARVAREQENVEAFRELRNELIGCWYTYLESEERKKEDMNRRLSKMLDVDVYPSSFDEDYSHASRRGSASGASGASSSAESPVVLDFDTMNKEGIPMQGNPSDTAMLSQGPMQGRSTAAETQLHHLRMMQLQIQAQQRAAMLRAQAHQANHMSLNQQSAALNPQSSTQSLSAQRVAAMAAQQQVLFNAQQLGNIPLQANPQGLQQRMVTQSPVQTGWTVKAQESQQHQQSAFAPPASSQQQVVMPLGLYRQEQECEVNTPELSTYDGRSRANASSSPSSSSSTSSLTNVSPTTKLTGPFSCLGDRPCEIHIPPHSYCSPRPMSNPPLKRHSDAHSENDAKKRRVDSGVEWIHVDHNTSEMTMEGGELMKFEDDRDFFMGWATQDNGFAGKGKGKEKARVGDSEVVWLD